MKFPWSSVRPQGTGPIGSSADGSGPETEDHSLVGSAEKSMREVFLLFLSMVLVMFNLLGQRRGPGASK